MIKHIPTIQDTIAQWQQKPDPRDVKREKLAVWAVTGLLAVIVVIGVLGMVGRL